MTTIAAAGAASLNTEAPHRAQQLVNSSSRTSVISTQSPAGGALASLARGSLMLGTLNAEANASNASLDLSSLQVPPSANGESSNTIIGPGGVLVPRNSILRNPSTRRTFVDKWRLPDVEGVKPAPAVLRIAAVPTLKEQKERERQRELDRLQREREIEQEVREKEQAEKVWGIPRKAFYLGLGEINFNAQMAMLGGWGNGSGGLNVDVMNRPTPLSVRKRNAPELNRSPEQRQRQTRKRNTPSANRHGTNRSSIDSARSRSTTRSASVRERSINATPAKPVERRDDYSDSDESMDLEELAALNAIINTRRSMEAAQALASSATKAASTMKRSRSQQEAEGKEDEGSTTRPRLSDTMQTSMDSVPTSKASDNLSESRPSLNRTRSTDPSSPTRRRGSPDRSSVQTARIRFAPLPRAFLPSSVQAQMERDGVAASPGDAFRLDAEVAMAANGGVDASGTARSDISGDHSSDSTSSDEEGEGGEYDTSSRRLSGLRNSKWYLMGMPKSVFNPQSYRALKRPLSGDYSASELGTSPGQERRLSAGNLSAVGGEAERRGRRRSRSRRGTSSRASSIKSRSSSVGSFDEEERERRRQLILASRPGGTGMVTLIDGRKIRARRVGETYSDEEDGNETEWGFGRLARAAERQSFGDVERPETPGDQSGTTFNGADMTMDDGGEEDKDADQRRQARHHRQTSLDGSAIADSDDSEVEEDDVDLSRDTISPRKREVAAHLPKRAGTLHNLDASTEGQAPAPAAGETTAERTEEPKAATDDPEEDPAMVRAPKRSLTMPSGPITLSASQAAEVRRRHEEEVAARGAEVLQAIALAKRAKQQMHHDQHDGKGAFHTAGEHEVTRISSNTGRPVRSQTVSHGHGSGKTESGALHSERERRGRTQTAESTKTVTARTTVHHDKMSSPLRHPSRTKPRTQSVLAVHSDPAKDEVKAQHTSHDTFNSLRRLVRRETDSAASSHIHLPQLKTPLRIQTGTSATNSGPQTPTHVLSPLEVDHDGDLTHMSASMASVRTLRGTHETEQADYRPGTPVKREGEQRNVVAVISPSKMENGSTLATQVMTSSSDPVAAGPMDVDGVAAAASTNVPVDVELKVSSPTSAAPRVPELPSPWNLPRRPDVRGYAVVDLPGGDVGRRPDRPREGRFWQSDEEADADEGTSSETERRKAMVKAHSRHPSRVKTSKPASDDEEDDDSDLDAAQLAEEERRTAAERKRATTRAAGAEVVSGLSSKMKQGKGGGNGEERAVTRRSSRSIASRDPVSRTTTTTSVRPSATPFPITGSTQSSLPSVTRRASLGIEQDDGMSDLRPVLSTSVLSTSRDRNGNPVARITRRRDTWNDFEETSREQSQTRSAVRDNRPLELSMGDLDLSDGDDLWPPTLDHTLGGVPTSVQDLAKPLLMGSGHTVSGATSIGIGGRRSSAGTVHRMGRSASNLSSSLGSQKNGVLGGGLSPSIAASMAPPSPNNPAGLPMTAAQRGTSPSSTVKLAIHAAKAKVVREKRERERKDRQREQERRVRENDESLDYGWPRSLDGSSLYG